MSVASAELAEERARLAGREHAPTAYLAGPDVFLPDPAAMAEAKRQILARYGILGRFPLDNALDLAGKPRAQAGLVISAANEALMNRCDCMVGNATPFHGPSMDIGTAFEVGYMRAQGKPLFLYSNDSRLFAERVIERVHGGVVVPDARGEPCGPDGTAVENFDLPDNLMIPGAALASGGNFRSAAAPVAEPLTELAVFRAAARDAAVHFHGEEAVRRLEALDRPGPSPQPPAAAALPIRPPPAWAP